MYVILGVGGTASQAHIDAIRSCRDVFDELRLTGGAAGGFLRPRSAQEQHQRHAGETQERDQHEAILIGCDSCLLVEMALHQHQYLRFLWLPERPGLPHQFAHRGKNLAPAQG